MTSNSSLCLSKCMHCCQLHLLYKPHLNLSNTSVTHQPRSLHGQGTDGGKGDILQLLLSVEQLVVVEIVVDAVLHVRLAGKCFKAKLRD